MLNIKELEMKFSNILKEKLLDKQFEMSGKFPPEIPKAVGEAFILNVLEYFPNILEFDVKPIVQGNILLVKVEADKELTLLDVILPINISNKTLTVKEIITSIKNL